MLLNQLLKGNIFKQGGIVLLDQGFLSIANFITGALVARSGSKEEYSLYVLAWSLLLIFSSLQRALIHVPLTVYLPKLTEKEKNTYQGSTLAHSIILGALIICGLVIANVVYGSAYGEQSADMQRLVAIIAALTLPMLLREYIRGALFARLHFFSSLVANLTGTLIQLSIVTYLYINEQLNITSAMTAILISSAYAACFMLWSQRSSLKISPRLIVKDFARSWKTGKWMLVNVAGMVGIAQIYPWLILTLVDAESVAIFGAALALSNVLSPLLRAVNAYILPKMSHGYSGLDVDNVKRMMDISIISLSIPYTIWVAIGSLYTDELMEFVYSNKYIGHSHIVIMLLYKSMIESISTPLTTALQALEKANITTISLAIGSTITLSIGAILVYKYGLTGAASSSLLTTAIIFIYKYNAISKIKQNLQGVTDYK